MGWKRKWLWLAGIMNKKPMRPESTLLKRYRILIVIIWNGSELVRPGRYRLPIVVA
jgi:hypothetical protein